MKSMTGYGAARGRAGRSPIAVEARSVNHRFCEANVRMPGRLAFLEHEITALVRKNFERGKFDLFIREEPAGADQVELHQAEHCLRLLKKIHKTLRLLGPIGLQELLSFWQIYGSRHPADEADLSRVRSPLLKIVREALKKLGRMRLREGIHLKKWFEGRLRRLVELLRLLGGEVRREAQQRQEGAESWPQRSDVTEEMVRLESHVSQFRRTVRQRGPSGRRMDFLAQEMVREINTLGSKVVGLKATHHVVDFKTELEKIREQIQNIE